MGKKFYLVHDPRIGLQFLVDTQNLRAEEVEEINILCADMGQPMITPSMKQLTEHAQRYDRVPRRIDLEDEETL